MNKKIVFNGISSVGQKISRIVEMIVLVPFFITYWGAEYYGEWITLSIIPSLMAMADIGLGSAGSNTFTIDYLKGNFLKARDIIINSLISITIMVLLITALTFVGLKISIIYNLFEGSTFSSLDIVITLTLMILSKMLNSYTQFFEGHFRAVRKAHLGINLISLNSLLNVIGGVIVLKMGGKIVDFALVNLSISVIFNFFYGFIAIKVLKFNDSFSGKFDLSLIKYLLKKGTSFFLLPISQSLYLQGTTFLVRIFLGPVSVTIFNTVRTLIRSVNQIFSIINKSTFPEVQYAVSRGDFRSIRNIYNLNLSIGILVSFLGFLVLNIFGEEIYQFWINNKINPPINMIKVFSFSYFFVALWWISGEFFNAFNKPRKYALSSFISSLLSLILSFFLIDYYGLIGAVIGGMLFDFILAVYLIKGVSKLIKQPIFSIIPNLLGYFSKNKTNL